MTPLSAILLIVFASIPTFLQQAPSSCCRLDVEVQPSNPAELKLTVTNIEEPTVGVLFMRAQADFTFRVTGTDGGTPELTEEGKILFDEVSVGSKVLRELARGDSLVQILDLRKIYILPAGTYDVALERAVLRNDVPIVLKAQTKISIP